jgi:hypothetical protein
MRFHVTFRYNAATGAVEAFEVDDLGSDLGEAEHNRRHDGFAHEVGRVIERRPRVREHLAPPALSGAEVEAARATEPAEVERDPSAPDREAS